MYKVLEASHLRLPRVYQLIYIQIYIQVLHTYARSWMSTLVMDMPDTDKYDKYRYHTLPREWNWHVRRIHGSKRGGGLGCILRTYIRSMYPYIKGCILYYSVLRTGIRSIWLVLNVCKYYNEPQWRCTYVMNDTIRNRSDANQYTTESDPSDELLLFLGIATSKAQE